MFFVIYAGTPLQNDLTELKTLLSFLEPQIFGENGEELDALEVAVACAFPHTCSSMLDAVDPEPGRQATLQHICRVLAVYLHDPCSAEP